MMTRAILTLTFVAALTLHVVAEGELTLTTERVVVFKDGYCLVVKKAVGTSAKDGTVYTEEVPDAAVLGSFWAIDPEGRIRSMTAGVESTEVVKDLEIPCRTYLEILKANVGKTVTVDLDNGEDLRGEILEVLTEENVVQIQPHQRSLLSSSFRFDPSGRYEANQLIGSLFALRCGEVDCVIPVRRVTRVVGSELAMTHTTKLTEKRSTKRLTFAFLGGAADREFRIMYFRPGVRWIPTYRIGLDEAKHEARITLQAEILNEAEDLVNVPFDLVVGVPNFRFKEVVSPFVLESALQNALARALPQLMGQRAMNSNFMSNAGFSSRSGEYRGPPPSGATGLDLPDDLTAGQSQDLYIYSLPALTVKKGQRAAVPVFEATTTYRDVYTWDLRLSRMDIEAAPSGQGASPLTLSTNRIWHQIELRNSSKMPWTTGAAMILSGMQPLAQELMTYTPGGGSVRVPVTVAIDLRGVFFEEETARKLDGLTWMRQKYARIEKQGKLSIRNYKDREIDLEITCRLGGRADEATHDGRITVGAFDKGDWQNYLGHPAVNNHSVVFFKLTLKPGETVSPEVKFHYFARH